MNDSNIRTDKRTLPLHWKLWFAGFLVVVPYMLIMILHWAGQLEEIPPGMSAIAHTIILGLFVAGCVAVLLDRLDTMAKAPPRLPKADTAEVIRVERARGYVEGVRERHRRQARR
jgi:hypothetical protein